MSSKTIKLDVIREGATIVCPDLAILGLVLATKAVAGNLKVYGVRMEHGRYIVPIDSIRRRIVALEDRKRRIDEYLYIMRQVTS